MFLFCCHIHHEQQEHGAEQQCPMCLLINTGFVLTATFCFNFYYFYLGILSFLSDNIIIEKPHFEYLMRAPPTAISGLIDQI